MKLSGIYCITNTETGKQYIGSSVDIQKRFVAHLCYLRKGNHHSQKLQRAWDKYGEPSFIFHIVDYVEDVEELTATEQQWLDSIHPEYNIDCIAGKRAIGYRPRSKEQSEKLAQLSSLRLKGKPSFFKGKKHSEESKEKMAAAKRGISREFTGEHRERLSIAAKSRKPTANFTGKHHSEESKKKMGQSRKGKPWSEARRAAQKKGC